MTFRRAFFAAFATAALLGLAWGCAATGDRDNLARASGGSNGLADASTSTDASVEPDGTARDAGMLGLNPLCHNVKSVTPGCVPDSPDSCRDFKPPDASAGDAGPDAYGQGGMSGGEGGAGGDSAGPIAASGASDGGASGSTGEGGAGAAAGESSVAGAAGATNVTPTTPAEYSCQVRRSDDDSNTPYSHCEPAGRGGENAPCLTSTDCQAGLGCVGDQTAGLCQPYCCQDADDCKAGTYCTPRPMRDALINSIPRSEVDQYTLQIPVCVHAKNCDLSTPYPCTKGSCACETGTACMVVRADGTTTCIPPGTGKLGQACPCAWGHICSAASNTCLKLCNTQDSSACGEGKCQSASQLPAGWGVCVGLPSGG